jgi:hypothetical protein
MKLIKTYEQFSEQQLLTEEFEKYLPEKLTIVKQIDNEKLIRDFTISADNIMRHANMTQVTYIADKKLYGHPDEMSIDIYYYHMNDKIKLTFDIIYGDFTSSEFSCQPPNEVNVIEYTSYHSKFDPSNTIFALDDKSIQKICDFINEIDGFEISPEHLNFLDVRDNFDYDHKF